MEKEAEEARAWREFPSRRPAKRRLARRSRTNTSTEQHEGERDRGPPSVGGEGRGRPPPPAPPRRPAAWPPAGPSGTRRPTRSAAGTVEDVEVAETGAEAAEHEGGGAGENISTERQRQREVAGRPFLSQTVWRPTAPLPEPPSSTAAPRRRAAGENAEATTGSAPPPPRQTAAPSPPPDDLRPLPIAGRRRAGRPSPPPLRRTRRRPACDYSTLVLTCVQYFGYCSKWVFRMRPWQKEQLE